LPVSKDVNSGIRDGTLRDAADAAPQGEAGVRNFKQRSGTTTEQSSTENIIT